MVGIFAMVENNKIISSTLQKIYNDIHKPDTDSIEHTSSPIAEVPDDVLLFFSFDIVNSSLYKTANYYGWSIAIDTILTSIRNHISSRIKAAEVWRILGDEIIFIVKIIQAKDIPEYVECIYDTLIRFCDKINTKEIFRDLKNPDMITDLNILSLQATAWIAAVTDKKYMENNKRKTENIFEKIEVSSKNKFYEFIGVDIDAGFRLTKETRAGRLTLSFELAYLLLDNKDCVEILKIITYHKLKGVWNNRSYPIIWYCNTIKDEKLKYLSFEESIPFDAADQDPTYKEFLQKSNNYLDYMYTDIKKALDKICTDIKLEDKIGYLKNLLSNDGREKRFIDDSLLELHCVAVCHNNKGEILIMRRSKNKHLHPEAWEFGCAKANCKESLVETIVNDYKADFGIDIELYMDETGTYDRQPIPIAVYTIEKKPELHKGIIFVAKIKNEKPTLDFMKHDKFMFDSEADLDKEEFYSDKTFVPDAPATMHKVFEYIKSTKNRRI